MAEPADHRSDGTRRGPLFVFVLVAAIAAGLWYWQTRTDTAPSFDQPVATDTESGTAIGTSDAGTAGTGAPDTAGTTRTGLAAQTDKVETAGSATTVPMDTAPTPDPDSTAREQQSVTADAATAALFGSAQAAGPGTTGREERTVTDDPATAGGTDLARTADAGTTAAPGILRAAETDTAATADTDRATDADAAGTELQTAAAEPAAGGAGEGLSLAPAPEDTIERVPLNALPDTLPDALPGAATIGTTGILAAVDRIVEKLETIVTEQLGTKPDADPETKLRVHVTYDDSVKAAEQAVAGTKKADHTTDSATGQPNGADKIADSATGRPTGTDQLAGAATGRLPDAGPIGDAVVPPPDAEVAATDDITRSTESERAAPPDDTRIAAADSAEAREYVEKLTDAAPSTIPADKADHFVTQEHVISLVPEDTIERVSIDALIKDETLDPETPITIVREVEQTETAVPEKLIAESGGDLDTRLHVVVRYDDSVGDTEEQGVAKLEAPEQNVVKLEATEQDTAGQDVATQDQARPESTGQVALREDTVEQTTVREVLERIRTEPDTPITLVRKVRFFEVMTLRELLDTGLGTGTFLDVVRQPYRVEAATLADLLQRKKAENPDTIFYVHTVLPTDTQGIWGIVHFGLIDNFGRGVAVRRGEEVETYTVEIPRDADERLADQSSSFLGLMIDRKTKDSYVYNFRDNRMGRNPDRIFPGQEIVIINFEPGELESIYEHFASG